MLCETRIARGKKQYSAAVEVGRSARRSSDEQFWRERMQNRRGLLWVVVEEVAEMKEQ